LATPTTGVSRAGQQRSPTQPGGDDVGELLGARFGEDGRRGVVQSGWAGLNITGRRVLQPDPVEARSGR
jgi:hypothetical protein